MGLALFSVLALDRSGTYTSRSSVLSQVIPSRLHAEKVAQLYREESEDDAAAKSASYSDRPQVKLELA